MRNAWLLAALVLAYPTAASAQAPAASAPPTPPPSHAPAYDPGLPPPPVVSDPMLTPVPPPKRVLTSWAEAQELLLTRSTTWKSALDNVLVAEGQTIMAFAQYLPSLGGCAGGLGTGGCGNATFTHQLLTKHAAESATGLQSTTTLPVPNTLSASMTLSQDILNFQEFDQIGINELMEKVARMTVSDTKRTLDLGLATQIVSVVTAERSAEINRSGLRVALEQQDITVRKEALGAATGSTSSARSRTRRTHARLSSRATKRSARRARRSVSRWGSRRRSASRRG